MNSQRGDLIEAFKFINGQHSGYLKDVFEISRANRVKSHQHKLVMEHSRTRLRQSFFNRRVVGNWNRLPNDVVGAESLALQKQTGQAFYRQRIGVPTCTHGTSCFLQVKQDKQKKFRNRIDGQHNRVLVPDGSLLRSFFMSFKVQLAFV